MMDSRLKVADSPRKLAAGVTAETPLVTVAWRAMREEHKRRAQERRQAEAEAAQTLDALAGIAEEIYRLKAVASLLSPEDQMTQSRAQHLVALAGRLEELLVGLGVEIIAPEGEPFTEELMEMIENVAQRQEPEATEMRVAEVIAPAILHRGAILKMGKAIISLPARTNESKLQRL